MIRSFEEFSFSKSSKVIFPFCLQSSMAILKNLFFKNLQTLEYGIHGGIELFKDFGFENSSNFCVVIAFNLRTEF